MKASTIDVLTEAEARAVRNQVHALRPLWTKQSATEFYTLGVSAYLEAQLQGAVAYTFAAKRMNPQLQAAFGPLYEAVRAALETSLGEPVAYAPRLALPGFQIFLADPTFESPVCSLHVDEPYVHLSWPSWEEVNLAQTISFTLAIAIPRGGAGLHVWPQISPAQALSGPPLHEQIRGLTPALHPYAVGRLVIHDGHSVHQIAPFRAVGDDERLTLQGHGVRGVRGWIVYF